MNVGEHIRIVKNIGTVLIHFQIMLIPVSDSANHIEIIIYFGEPSPPILMTPITQSK